MSRKSITNDWLTAIATKTELEIIQVEELLVKHRIDAMPVASTPKHLLLKRIRFTGAKSIEGVESPIDFEWKDLDSGVWAILSDENLRGKSSIIQIVRGCLRGNLSNSVQADVYKWLRSVEMDFRIDEQDFRLRVELGESLSGTLIRQFESNRTRKVYSFDDEGAFEAAMANFFMKHFDFDKFAIYRGQDEKGTTVLHGWPSLCAAMFIGTNYETIIGELPPQSGVPVRLLQMFLGIPWVTTSAAASAALKEEVRKQSAADQVQKDAKELTQRRLDELADQLKAKEESLSKATQPKKLQSDLTNCSQSLQDSSNRQIEIMRQLREANVSFEEAKSAADEDRQALRLHEEDSSAQTVFRALDPKSCPRCETAISQARKRQEQATNCCAVCGGSVHSDMDEAEIRQQLASNLKASKDAQAEAKKRLNDLNAALEEVKQAVKNLADQQDKITRQMSRPTKYGELQADVAGLRARIDELSMMMPKASDVSTDVGFLKVVEDETKKRMKEHQDLLLAKISTRIVDYAQRFGMVLLESAKLSGGLQLQIVKSGTPSSYSRLTDGEKLRLKLATLAALIVVGEEENVGRYPGLLVIDSPGAQEVAYKDLEQIIAGLNDVAKEINHLQVIVGSRASGAICEQIAKTQCVQAVGTDYLW